VIEVMVVVVEDIAAVTLLLYWDRAGVEQMVLVFVCLLRWNVRYRIKSGNSYNTFFQRNLTK